MTLPVGVRLGSYEVLSLIGAGGMGEVYRARDTRLKREVALKVLPDAFSDDPDRLARFHREAELLATLNHPNIAAVYGFEEAQPMGPGESATRSRPVAALVQELVEGPTLADRIRKGPIPVDAALPIARQLAEALEAAHEKSIVHRDLKPANVKIKEDGIVKVLDFGLAKALIADSSNPAADSMNSPTLTARATGLGVIIGTAPYMAPEQARGTSAVDRRADIWAFGAVLYEMLSGQRAFKGDSVADILAAVLRQDIDWTALPSSTPPPARHLIARCLERDVKRRLRDIGEARIALDDVVAGDTTLPFSQRVPVLSPTPKPLWRRVLPTIAALVASALVGAVSWWYFNRQPPTPQLVTQFLFTLPEGQSLTGATRHMIAISPDGSQMVYVANNRLYRRLMSDLNVKAIQGTEGYQEVDEPAFAPDGRAVAFYALSDRTLKRIDVTGGMAVTLCAANMPTGISWGPNGIMFGQSGEGIMRLAPNSRTPEVVVRVKNDEVAHGPQLLPGGEHVLFTLAAGTAPDRWDKAKVVVQSIRTGERRTVVDGGSDARYVATGHILYAFSGNVFGVAFDAGRLEVSGEPVRLVEGVRRATGLTTGLPGSRIANGAANFSVSNSGSLIYVPGPPIAAGALVDIALMDRQGAVDPLKLPFGQYELPRVSPDGKRLAFGADDGREAAIWIYDLSRRSAMQRLTFGGNNRFPVWTSDSKRVAFQSDRDGDLAMFWLPADGTGTAERLTKPNPGESHVPESSSPNGETLLFSVTRGSDVSLSTLGLNDRKVTPFGDVHTSSPPGPVFSPDGRWVAYASTERGMTTTYVQPFPATGAKYQFVASNLAESPKHPRWSSDGKELFLNTSATEFVGVSVTTQPTFAFGTPVALSKALRGGPTGTHTAYDVTPDGKFVGLVTAGQTQFGRGSENQIQVVLNWVEELRARVPVP
jgi:serine/threonine protein kinase/Tol biopolymer transport system component